VFLKHFRVALTHRLGEGESLVPVYATHKIGVAGLVLNPDNEVLVIREARSVDGSLSKFGRGWKLPGGLSDLGEDFGVTVGGAFFRSCLFEAPRFLVCALLGKRVGHP
jgi:hypothetical protein